MRPTHAALAQRRESAHKHVRGLRCNPEKRNKFYNITLQAMRLKSLRFNYNGHSYNVNRIEGAEKYSVVRDDRNVRSISNQALQVAIANKELEHVIERLFNDEKQ